MNQDNILQYYLPSLDFSKNYVHYRNDDGNIYTYELISETLSCFKVKLIALNQELRDTSDSFIYFNEIRHNFCDSLTDLIKTTFKDYEYKKALQYYNNIVLKNFRKKQYKLISDYFPEYLIGD